MFAAALLLAQAAAPAAAGPLTPERADARCIAAFGIMGANAAKDEVLRASQMGALYFYGKLLGRNPGIDLKAAMLAGSQAVAPDVRGEIARCGAELQRSGQAMQAVGQAIGAGAPSPAPTPAPTKAAPKR